MIMMACKPFCTVVIENEILQQLCSLSLKINADDAFTLKSPFHLGLVCMQINELISDKSFLLKCKISTSLASEKMELFMSAFS